MAACFLKARKGRLKVCQASSLSKWGRDLLALFCIPFIRASTSWPSRGGTGHSKYQSWSLATPSCAHLSTAESGLFKVVPRPPSFTSP